MTYDRPLLDAAHRHCARNREELEASTDCGCIYCLATFQPSEIVEWLPEGSGTAFCPRCSIDSVVGSASGYPVTDPLFLRAMRERWFRAKS